MMVKRLTSREKRKTMASVMCVQSGTIGAVEIATSDNTAWPGIAVHVLDHNGYTAVHYTMCGAHILTYTDD
jgi:hypothetical protein